MSLLSGIIIMVIVFIGFGVIVMKGVNGEDNNSKENTVAIQNRTAKIIKILAILNAISGVILGLIGLEEFEVYAVIFIIVGLISSVFVYAIGEIIQLLEDIKNK